VTSRPSRPHTSCSCPSWAVAAAAASASADTRRASARNGTTRRGSAPTRARRTACPPGATVCSRTSSTAAVRIRSSCARPSAAPIGSSPRTTRPSTRATTCASRRPSSRRSRSTRQASKSAHASKSVVYKPVRLASRSCVACERGTRHRPTLLTCRAAPPPTLLTCVRTALPVRRAARPPVLSASRGGRRRGARWRGWPIAQAAGAQAARAPAVLARRAGQAVHRDLPRDLPQRPQPARL
jgi:hypothetical protein